jgi:virginiamycin B lyase
MWFTESAYGNNGNVHGKIGRVDLSKKPYKVSEYNLPYNHGKGTPWSIALGSDGALWSSDPENVGIGRIDTGFNFSLYSVPEGFPFGITSGAGGLWFIERTANGSGAYVGRIDAQTHELSEYQVPASYPQAYEITSRGNHLWFTEQNTDKVACFSIKTHAFHQYALPKKSGPRGLSVGQDKNV